MGYAELEFLIRLIFFKFLKMPGMRYNDETNDKIEILLSCGVPPKKIAADLNIDPNVIYRKRSRLKLFKVVNPFPLSVQGRRRTLNREHKKAIKDFLISTVVGREAQSECATT